MQKTFSNLIKAKRVPDYKRLSFLPKKLPEHYLSFEEKVYKWAERVLEDYTGGFWDFFELPNDGFYLVPSGKSHWVVNSTNSNTDVLTPDGAGIVVTTFALWNLAYYTQNYRHIEFYENLRKYASTHTEATAIYWLLD